MQAEKVSDGFSSAAAFDSPKQTESDRIDGRQQ